jgi:hypothetical protein
MALTENNIATTYDKPVKDLQHWIIVCIILLVIILLTSGFLGNNTLEQAINNGLVEKSNPTLQPGVIQAGRQYYITLVGILAIFVFLPWMLLGGFAFQKAIRMNHSLVKDLDYLCYDTSSPSLTEKRKTRFNFWGYFWPLILITIFLNINIIWLFFPSGIDGLIQFTPPTSNSSLSLNIYLFQVILKNLPTASVAVLVGYVYMLFQLVRRYNRDDITPNVFWEMIKHLVWAYVITFVATALVASFASNTAALAFGLSFAIISGIYEVESLQYLLRTAQILIQKIMSKLLDKTGQTNDQFSKLASHLAVDHPLYLLDDLDKWDADRLMEEGVIGVQGMATVDMDQMVIWTPYPTRQIVDWVDQAILFMATGLGSDFKYFEAFRKIGLRTASCLLEATSRHDGIKTVVEAMNIASASVSQKPQTQSNPDPLDNRLTLTEEVLRTILISLERNGNLRRVWRFKTLDAENVICVSGSYKPNNGWLF